MSANKRIDGSFTITTLNASDAITFQGLTANAANVVIDGNLTVTGNAALSGNISGDNIFNGTTSIAIPSPSGNATVTIGGTSNVAIFTTAGVSVAGNINVGNLIAGQVSATGNVQIVRDASAGTPSFQFRDTDTTISDGTVIGSLEWYSSDATPGARVTSAIQSVATGGLGNATVQILTSDNGGAAAARITVVSTGNVGVANTTPRDNLAVSGTTYVSGNVTGGNLLTGGLISATGNITSAANIAGGNILTGGLISATGNITGGNINSSAVVSATGNISTTANVDGGNLNSTGQISSTGTISVGGDVIITSGGVLSTTGNVRGGNIVTSGLVTATGVINSSSNVNGANVNSTGVVSAIGNLVTTANVNGGNLKVTSRADIGSLALVDSVQSATYVAAQLSANAITIESYGASSWFNATGSQFSQLYWTSNIANADPVNGNDNYGWVYVSNNGTTISSNVSGTLYNYGFYANGAAQFPNSVSIVSGNINTLANVNANVVAATSVLQLPVYASNAARDSAITSPVGGMMVFVTDGDGAGSPKFQGYGNATTGWTTL